MVTFPLENLLIAGVDSDFDYCQTTIKQLFNDKEFCSDLENIGFQLSAANSINFGRLLPQVASSSSSSPYCYLIALSCFYLFEI